MAKGLTDWLKDETLQNLKQLLAWKRTKIAKSHEPSIKRDPEAVSDDDDQDEDDDVFSDDGSNLRVNLTRPTTVNSNLRIVAIEHSAAQRSQRKLRCVLSDGHVSVKGQFAPACAGKAQRDTGRELRDLEGAIISVREYVLTVTAFGSEEEHITLYIESARFKTSTNDKIGAAEPALLRNDPSFSPLWTSLNILQAGRLDTDEPAPSQDTLREPPTRNGEAGLHDVAAQSVMSQPAPVAVMSAASQLQEPALPDVDDVDAFASQPNTPTDRSSKRADPLVDGLATSSKPDPASSANLHSGLDAAKLLAMYGAKMPREQGTPSNIAIFKTPAAQSKPLESSPSVSDVFQTQVDLSADHGSKLAPQHPVTRSATKVSTPDRLDIDPARLEASRKFAQAIEPIASGASAPVDVARLSQNPAVSVTAPVEQHGQDRSQEELSSANETNTTATATTKLQRLPSPFGRHRSPDARYVKYASRRLPQAQRDLLSDTNSLLPSLVGQTFPQANIPIDILNDLVNREGRIDRPPTQNTDIDLLQSDRPQDLESMSEKIAGNATNDDDEAEPHPSQALPWSRSPTPQPRESIYSKPLANGQFPPDSSAATREDGTPRKRKSPSPLNGGALFHSDIDGSNSDGWRSPASQLESSPIYERRASPTVEIAHTPVAWNGKKSNLIRSTKKTASQVNDVQQSQSVSIDLTEQESVAGAVATPNGVNIVSTQPLSTDGPRLGIAARSLTGIDIDASPVSVSRLSAATSPVVATSSKRPASDRQYGNDYKRRRSTVTFSSDEEASQDPAVKHARTKRTAMQAMRSGNETMRVSGDEAAPRPSPSHRHDPTKTTVHSDPRLDGTAGQPISIAEEADGIPGRATVRSDPAPSQPGQPSAQLQDQDIVMTQDSPIDTSPASSVVPASQQPIQDREIAQVQDMDTQGDMIADHVTTPAPDRTNDRSPDTAREALATQEVDDIPMTESPNVVAMDLDPVPKKATTPTQSEVIEQEIPSAHKAGQGDPKIVSSTQDRDIAKAPRQVLNTAGEAARASEVGMGRAEEEQCLAKVTTVNGPVATTAISIDDGKHTGASRESKNAGVERLQEVESVFGNDVDDRIFPFGPALEFGEGETGLHAQRFMLLKVNEQAFGIDKRRRRRIDVLGWKLGR